MRNQTSSLAKIALATAFSTGILAAEGCQTSPWSGIGYYLNPLVGNHCPRENGYSCCGLWDYLEGDPGDYCPDFHDDQ